MIDLPHVDVAMSSMTSCLPLLLVTCDLYTCVNCKDIIGFCIALISFRRKTLVPARVIP